MDCCIFFAYFRSGINRNIPLGLSMIETSFSILAVPIVITLVSSTVEFDYNDILKSFSVGVVVSCLILFVNALIRFSIASDSQVFYYYELAGLLGTLSTVVT